MKSAITIIAIVFVAICGITARAQVKPKPKPSASPTTNALTIKATAAYSEVLLRKAELTAELESLLIEYTDEYPKAKSIKTELTFLQKEIDRLLAVAPSDAGKLSTALGKLMIRKAQVETELVKLQADYNEEHPDLKAARRKVEVFESAIKEILN